MTGPTGATGATGPSGVPGINGVQFYTLGGGDLGSNVELLFGYQSVLGGDDAASGGNPFCVTGTCSNSPIYYGPGNGADTQLESVAVPIDASTVTQLWVQTKNVPGAGEHYTFQLCINSDCWSSPVRCTISLPTETECNDLVDKGTATGGAAATEVSWMVVTHQTGGDIPTPPAP